MDERTRPDGRLAVAVVGGGQAGLAIGYYLAQQGHRFAIFEAEPEPAASWRRRWDSLTLFTPARYDALPGRPFPGHPDRYPVRDEVADYLTDYARHFALPVQLGSRVERLRQDAGGYTLELADRAVQADQVVVATGPFQVPFVPPLAGGLAPEVTQLHSVDYRNPGALPGGPVLVVGGGNTGYQIAAELAASREVHLSIGTRQTPLPQRLLGRDLFQWLEATGLMRRTVHSRLGRRLKDRETLVGSNARMLRRRHGVQVHDRVTGASGTEITFADGSRQTAGTVIWATGYRHDHSWIDAPIFDNDGRVEHERGVTAAPGLYFLGLTWQHTRGSALLGWVKDDAAYIAQRIAEQQTAMNRPDAHAAPATPATQGA